MTAICGIWNLDGAPGAMEACARMHAALAIYGRDRERCWDDGAVALGLQFLRTVPEDRFDEQPLTGGGGRYVLLADARIDNRPELAEALGLPAGRAAAMADSDYILAAWEQWGEDCLERLYGDYAFALWDSVDRALTLVRDPMGNRPLFVHRRPGRVGFASMAKGLHALPDIPRIPDEETVRDFLALLPHEGERTIFAGIERVEPGHLLRVRADGHARAIAWYDRDRNRTPHFVRPQEYVDALRDLFDSVVSSHLRTDAPVASHLSGGRDSTAVTATAAALLAGRGERLTAYTHVPPRGAPLMEVKGRFGDEESLAASVAARYPNIDHVLVDSARRRIGDDFDSAFHGFEYPLLNPCNSLWLDEINRQAAVQGARVMLVGKFGNHSLTCTGHERLAELVRQGRLMTWMHEGVALVRSGEARPLAVAWQSVAPFLPAALLAVLRRAKGNVDWSLENYSALAPAIARSPALQARMAELRYDPRFLPASDVRTARRGALWRSDYLPQIDKGVLASTGIDTRDPTRDRRLVEFSLGLPSNLLFRNGQSRWLFRHAFAERLPDAILDERRKGLQAADWATRLRRDLPALREELERAGHSPTATQLLDLPALLRLAEEGPKGTGASPADDIAYRCRFLRGVAVAHFLRKIEAGNH